MKQFIKQLNDLKISNSNNIFVPSNGSIPQKILMEIFINENKLDLTENLLQEPLNMVWDGVSNVFILFTATKYQKVDYNTNFPRVFYKDLSKRVVNKFNETQLLQGEKSSELLPLLKKYIDKYNIIEKATNLYSKYLKEHNILESYPNWILRTENRSPSAAARRRSPSAAARRRSPSAAARRRSPSARRRSPSAPAKNIGSFVVREFEQNTRLPNRTPRQLPKSPNRRRRRLPKSPTRTSRQLPSITINKKGYILSKNFLKNSKGEN
jgi:hypothetical protein